jgi:hypothetical protein
MLENIIVTPEFNDWQILALCVLTHILYEETYNVLSIKSITALKKEVVAKVRKQTQHQILYS